jgi:hypothetical protein
MAWFQRFGVAADITCSESLLALRARCERIDVLVNNAALDDKVEHDAAGHDRSRFEDYPVDK